jgi:hypothetical protein
MKPLEFVAAVVPSAGVLCVAEFSSKKKQHVFAEDVEGLAPAIKQFTDEKKDVYFALASFIESGKRTAGNALFMRSVFMDIDCGDGKAYPNKSTAGTALYDFLQKTKLGTLGNPWVVSSGGGIHVYWPFTDNIPIVEWRVAAENLKRLCKENDLHIDYTVTADAARVLRVPETTNWKYKDKPRKVKVLEHGAKFNFAEFCVAVVPVNGVAHPVSHSPTLASIPGKRPTRSRENATHIKIVENSVTKFRNILIRTQEGTGCHQLAYYAENASKDGMEPLWRGMLSLAKSCEDGDKAARLLSKMHPYDEDRMQQKLREIKGPYPCSKLDGENPGVCDKCPHFGKITNPLMLGRELATDNAPKEVTIEVPSDSVSKTPEQIKVTRATPPRGFSYGKNGGVYREAEVQDEEGSVIKKQVLVLPYDLFAVDLLNIQGEHTVHMLATRREGAINITLPQKAVVSKDDTVKALAAQNIIASYGAGNDKNLFDYVRGCVEDISTNKHAVSVPSSYGWQQDGGFVAGGRVFMVDGTVRQIPMPGLENLTHACKSRGDLEAWRKYVNIFVARKFWDILAIGAGVGFGSPLMEFSGLDGLTFHCGSSQSGTGKTQVLQIAASIWGHPRDYCVNKSTSAVAMQQRAGLLRNLPLISDEITSKNRRDMEWFPEFVFEIAEGRAKERMESGANKERLNTSVWALMAIVSSNTHVMDYMTGGRKHSSEGEIRRMLEWTTTESLSWDAHEVETIKSLRLNYGVAGDIYAKWLSVNRATAMSVYQQVYTKIRDEFSMSNDERYWHAAIAACLAGCILAGTQYSGVVDMPIQPLIDSMKRLVEKARGTVRSNVRSAEDVLNAYIREHYGKFISVKVTNDGHVEATYANSEVTDESITRSQIFGRVERHVTPGYVNFFIEESLLKQYCSTMSFGYADFRKELEKLYRVDYVKKDMLAKTKGPQMRVNALKISRPEAEVFEMNIDETPSPLPVG